MLSDWTGDQINPVFDKDTFSNEFETFGVQASPTTAPELERLNGEVMVKKFVDGVSFSGPIASWGKTHKC
jgi:hypothetical protein